MRLKIAMSAFTVFFVLSVAFIPAIILNRVIRVDLQPVTEQNYQSTVPCYGEIIEMRMREIYLDTPVIAQSVEVRVGDRVKRGQTLAVINTDLTQTVLSRGITEESSTTADPSAAFSVLARQYGVSADQIAGVMGQSATPPKVSTDFSGEIPWQVTAPINGVVTAVNLQEDVLTQGAKPILVISDDNAMAVRVMVNESEVAKLQEGSPASITGTGFAGAYSGVVTNIAPVAHKALSGAVQQTVVDVEIRIDAPDRALKPGFTAKAEIAAAEERTILTVPYEAVRQSEEHREYVYVYHQNQVRKRYITTGMELSEGVEVTEGLAAGELVVSTPELEPAENDLVIGRLVA